MRMDEVIKTMPASVVVAMSGGVDSSFAAALLKTGGWDVHGLHFILPGFPARVKARTDAVRCVAERLKIPLEITDLRQIFTVQIIDPFVDAYLQGLTPNPCVRCNALIKFEYLSRYAKERGIPYIATGHYARLRRGHKGFGVELLRGRDRSKEQSYFLHRVGSACLSMAVFPLGEMTKQEAKRQAAAMGFAVHSMSESQEICFIAGDDYRLFVEQQRGLKTTKSGKIVTGHGQKLGEHTGFYRYTIGQRHGLGIASSRPYYVKRIRPETNEVVVARKEELFSTQVTAEDFAWLDRPPDHESMGTEAQIRYRHRSAPGRLETISSKKVRFFFEKPQWAVTPGQALVCYDGDRVIGGGWIQKA